MSTSCIANFTAINVRLVVFLIIYKGGHARDKEAARKMNIDYGLSSTRSKRETSDRKIAIREESKMYNKKYTRETEVGG